jgi:hypothetical protein
VLASRSRYIAAACSALCFLSLAAYGSTSRGAMRHAYVNFSYWLSLLLFATWAFCLRRDLHRSGFCIADFLLRHRVGLVSALVLTTMAFCTVPVGYKVLSDETNLLSVSRSFHESRRAANITMAAYRYGDFVPLKEEIPNRPLAFPFLVSVLHDITGFRPENAFVVNSLVLFLMLAGLFAAVNSVLDVESALAAQLLVFATPLTTIYATSAGFDLLNALCFGISLVVVFHFLRSPRETSVSLLLATLLVFANVRYESALISLLLAFAAAAASDASVTLRWAARSAFAAKTFLFSLLCLPFIWQRILNGNGLEAPPSTPPFSWSSFREHATLLARHFADPGGGLPYAGAINVIGVGFLFASGVLFICRRHSWPVHVRRGAAITFAAVGLHLLVVLSFHFGLYTHPVSARYFLPFSLLLVLGVVSARFTAPFIVSRRAILALALIAAVYYHPLAMQGSFENRLTLRRATELQLRVLSSYSPSGVLIIARRPGRFAAMGYAAVSFSHANGHPAFILNSLRDSRLTVIAFQEFGCRSHQTSAATWLREEYGARIRLESRVAPSLCLRISRLGA